MFLLQIMEFKLSTKKYYEITFTFSRLEAHKNTSAYIAQADAKKYFFTLKHILTNVKTCEDFQKEINNNEYQNKIIQ